MCGFKQSSFLAADNKPILRQWNTQTNYDDGSWWLLDG